MRWQSIMGMVGLTEVMAHFLSLGWGMMTVLAGFAWVGLTAAATATKAASTEQRVNGLVPVVADAHNLATNAYPKTGGTISGSVTVTGNHVVNGQINSSSLGVSGTAITGAVTTNGLAVFGTVNTNGAINSGPVNAVGQVSGSNFSGGSIHVSGSSQTDGNHSVGGQSSANNFSGGSIHVSGSAQADGTFTAGGDVNSGGTVRGAVHASSIAIDTMGAVASPAATLAGLKQAVDGMLNRL